jgi:K+-sensing histidine kinase KdpD
VKAPVSGALTKIEASITPVRPRPVDLKRSAVSALLGGLAVAALTFVTYRSDLDFSIASPLYLFVVVFQSLSGDFLAAAAVSILAVLCLDYFFTPPCSASGLPPPRTPLP